MTAAVRKKRGLLAMIRGYGWLVSGTGLSYVMSALTFILIARMLKPADYGIIQVALAFTGLMGWLSLAGFAKVYIREAAGTDDRQSALYPPFLGLSLAAASSTVVFALILLPFFSLEAAAQVVVLILLPISIFQAFSLMWSSVFTSRFAFRTMALTDLARQGVYVVLVVALLLLPASAALKVYLLAVSQLCSYVAVFLIRYMIVRRYVSAPLRPAWPRLSWLIWRAGLVLSAFSVLTTLFGRVDLLFANAWLTPVEVGLYGVAFNASGKGSSLIMLSGVVIFPALAARYKRSGPISGMTLLKGSLLYGGCWACLAVVLWVLAPWLFSILFGSEYAGAVSTFRVLLFANLAFAFGYPLTNYVVASGGEMLMLAPLAVRGLVNVGCDWLFLAIGWGASGIAASTIVASTVFTLALAYVTWRRASRPDVSHGPTGQDGDASGRVDVSPPIAGVHAEEGGSCN